MVRYVSQRFAQAIVTVMIVTVVIFVVVRLIGDPTHLMLPPLATEADRELLRQQMGLADPIIVQYGHFLWNMLQGDFGTSYRYGEPALQVVLGRVGPTLLLTTTALSFGVLVGIPLGVASAIRPDSAVDFLGKGVALFGQAAPPFFFGIVFILIFSVQLNWFPTSGFGGLSYLVLPSIALGWFSAAGLMRLTRSSMLDVLNSEYVRMARIKGVPERVVVYRHALKNASLPILTYASLQFGALMGGAVAIESIFAWPGIGKLVLDSISNLDYTVVQAAVTLSALMFTLINLTVDLLYAMIDPRIRYA